MKISSDLEISDLFRLPMIFVAFLVASGQEYPHLTEGRFLFASVVLLCALKIQLQPRR